MTTGHTPGPWRVQEFDTSPPEKWVFGADNFTVVATSVGGTDDNWQANARLIAAAPDLLRALENALEADGPGTGWEPDAQAAIAAAYGEAAS